MTACNLQEIYSACQSKKSGEPALVPSLISQRVYHSSYGWGRLWKWFYLAVQFLTGKDLKTKRLIKIMQKMEKIFSKKLPQVIENAAAYQDYLEKRIREEEVDENEVHALRKNVRRWTRATAPLSSIVEKKQNEKITSLFQTYYPDSIERGELPFSYGQGEVLLRETQLLIDLEGYLHSPLPLALFKKLARKEDLSSDEQHELEKWIKILNKKKENIPVDLFIDCLRVLTKKPSFGGSLIELKVRLLQNNLELLRMKEEKHLSWRAALQPGDELESGSHTYRLGEAIGVKSEGFDSTLIFEIEGNEDHVIAVGMNRAYWSIKQKVANEFQWGIKMPEIKEISPDGRFAIIERLTPAISENQWESPENQPLVESDLSILDPISNLFKWWGKESVCPANFSLNRLMFNMAGELKYTHSLQPTAFDFRLLEDLAYEIAQGNLNVYLHIMQQSKLSSHLTMNFYRRVVEASLKNESVKIRDLAAYRKISDPVVIQRGRKLYKKIQKLRAKIIKTLNKEFDHIDQHSLLANANKELKEWYEGTCSASRLWPSIEEAVTGNLRRPLQLGKDS